MRALCSLLKAACGPFNPWGKRRGFCPTQALSLSSAVAVALLASAALHAQDRVFDRKVPADPRGRVEISNVSGKVDVSGWDRPEVSVHGDLEGGVDRIDIASDHGHTTITVRLPSYSFHGGGANLRVQIPRGSELDVSSVSADVTSTAVQGAQRLKTVSGQIKADIAQSDVETKTVSGDVTLHGHGQPAELHVTTISGNVRLDHGAGEFEATTVSGDLTVQLDPARSVRVRTTSGDFSFQGKLTKDADFDAQTVSGEIKLHAGAEAGYQYEVLTFSGEARDCFNVEAERTSKYAPGHRLSGTRGGGQAHVRLKTMSGEVDLCDRP
jgi:DUF4097 and DUF4098 domain-containing protein YvlB